LKIISKVSILKQVVGMIKPSAGIIAFGALLGAELFGQTAQTTGQATGQTTTPPASQGASQTAGQTTGQRAGRPNGRSIDRSIGEPGGRGPRPWWDGDLSKNANLNEAQQKQVLQIRGDFRPRMREVQQAVNKADAEVAAAFNEEPVDQAKANDAINRLAAARAEATRTVSQFSLKLRNVLTAQQWQEMQHPGPWPDRPGGRRRGPPPRSTSTSTTNQQK
jgi:Spy/CpxP family protein refolding chaperone